MVTTLVFLFHLKDIFGLQMYTLVTLAHMFDGPLGGVLNLDLENLIPKPLRLLSPAVMTVGSGEDPTKGSIV